MFIRPRAGFQQFPQSPSGRRAAMKLAIEQAHRINPNQVACASGRLPLSDAQPAPSGGGLLLCLRFLYLGAEPSTPWPRAVFAAASRSAASV